ncbi:hypothetical protein ACFQPC_15900 [Herminiimonas glaciei]|uniref:Uncharacterized protein n=1 Tax=Herminiimonas glaciei TaxID=523788 RepID=A0ABW2IF11_9BURK
MNINKKPAQQSKLKAKPQIAVSPSKAVKEPSGNPSQKTKTPWTISAQKRIHAHEAIINGGKVEKSSLTAHVMKRVSEKKA